LQPISARATAQRSVTTTGVAGRPFQAACGADRIRSLLTFRISFGSSNSRSMCNNLPSSCKAKGTRTTKVSSFEYVTISIEPPGSENLWCGNRRFYPRRLISLEFSVLCPICRQIVFGWKLPNVQLVIASVFLLRTVFGSVGKKRLLAMTFVQELHTGFIDMSWS